MEAINKKELFKNAWVAARNAVYNNRCGKPSDYFAECLKARWAFEKAVRAPRKQLVKKIEATTKVAAIKDWFVSKNFVDECFMIYMNREEITTLQESEKAVFVKISTFYGQSFKTWVPKSCIAA